MLEREDEIAGLPAKVVLVAYDETSLLEAKMLRGLALPCPLLLGERFLGLAPDMFQLGGDFVVDPAGRVAFAYRMQSNGDRAPVAQLVDWLGRVAGEAAADGAAAGRPG